jgi:hypothetical protein
VLELAMDSRVTHPTKEQVRAYMLAREHEHRPPPPPEEIRRQLGWRLAPPDPPCALLGMCLLPATLGQLAAQAALGWMLVPLRAQLGMDSLPGETLPH